MSAILNLLLSATRVAVWRQAAGAMLARAATFCLLLVMSIALALAGLGFGLYAAFISLSLLIQPAAAAATIGAVMAAIAAIMAILAFRRSRAAMSPRTSEARAATTATEAIDSLTNSLSQWVQANPGRATAIALVIGFLLGSRR